MTRIIRISIFAFAAVALLWGLAPTRTLNATASTNGRVEVAWKHTERAVKTVDSTFKINLPNISQGGDWLVGVKPIKAGEKERMYVGVFTWEAVKQGGAAKTFKRLSQMEDYPQELLSLGNGSATLDGSVSSDETLVIYMEVAPSTQTIFNANGKERALNASEGSYLLFDGEVEKTLIEHTGSLIARANSKKLKKEFLRSNDTAANQGLGLKYGIGIPAGYVAGEPTLAQECVTESPIESCVGGECTCWSVTTTCGAYSCSASGGSCRESGGVSISWTVPTACNF